MLAHFYIHRLSNNMKIAVQKNHLGGQIWYRSADPAKKHKTQSYPNIWRIMLILFMIYDI